MTWKISVVSTEQWYEGVFVYEACSANSKGLHIADGVKGPQVENYGLDCTSAQPQKSLIDQQQNSTWKGIVRQCGNVGRTLAWIKAHFPVEKNLCAVLNEMHCQTKKYLNSCFLLQFIHYLVVFWASLLSLLLQCSMLGTYKLLWLIRESN